MDEVCSVAEGKPSSMYYPPKGDSSSFRHQPTPTPLNDQATMADHTYPAQIPPSPPPSPSQFYQRPYMPPTPPTKPYSKLVLFVLAFSCFISFILIGIGGSKDGTFTLMSSFGVSLFIGVLVCVLVIDWHGFTTLQGWINWKQTHGKKRVLLICLYLFVCEVLLPIYLIRAAMRAYTNPPQPAFSAQSSQASRRRMMIGFIAGGCIALISFVSTASAQPSTSTSSLAQNTAIATAAVRTPQSTQPKTEPTPTPKRTPPPTPRPTIAPTAVPTQPPVAQTQPTQPPAPPVHTGVNGNPWGYDFSPGSLIYQPPSNFCDYFACIASFWQHTNGYVDECNDGMYSHSGGVSGACSRHGGEMRPLYSPEGRQNMKG